MSVLVDPSLSDTSYVQESHAVTGKTTWCHCKFGYVSKFTGTSHSLPAIAWLSCSGGLCKTHLFCKSRYLPFKVMLVPIESAYATSY